ncbi:MAG: glycosyltransferase family 9 protein [Pigmentiphaga sp.]|uniref:glycosyltransferase family 9 protein n=1 Tax=Pigmentiphaga sp. TaxID=1977564 RepID=UPI0029AA1E7F|nr:glycosyltransferase family 9 protein [Pigmentiphaga sp.]MDX3904921.1 glycosyltransferase family 9 protein [Pigmentiphaga sp.]
MSNVAADPETAPPTHPLQRDWHVAFVMSPRIGDTLISMVVVQNLVRQGWRVTVFSDHLRALEAWFPGFDIRPRFTSKQARRHLAGTDVVLHAYAADVVGDVRQWHPRAWVMDEWAVYRQVKPMVDIQLDVCRHALGLHHATRHNGLVVPGALRIDVVRNRVIIHPTASALHKQWLPIKFLDLARRLRDAGYEPCFVVAPAELISWRWVERHGFRVAAHGSLGDLAAWLIQAGLFIGNDSGLAHLASNVGVPAISLAMRPSIARRWAPGWAPSIALTPLPLLPGRWLKEACWKYLLPVSKVMGAVDRLRVRMAGSEREFGVDVRPRLTAPVHQVANGDPLSPLAAKVSKRSTG